MSKYRISEAVERLRTYIDAQDLALNERIPPERLLCIELGLTRAGLRSAMSVLESEGRVWRQVGRGTFIGARSVLNLSEVRYLSGITTPDEIADARLIIEPELARLAAENAVSSDHKELRRCYKRCSEATDWRAFEAWDNRFHSAIATATRNKLLMTVFETLNAVRRSYVWQTQRSDSKPSANFVTVDEHNEICQAILRKKPDEAADAMRAHLLSVRKRLILRDAEE
ncbi:FCD domain-containing protein [Hoeflea sp. YIM 152468]|uniref:FadR/GntR family transcriptional regulator n=1 Tax=Hoeflea sp. YIM 152468 TaxID=3031759 RepID=UPI0023DAE8D6|nr:FCD domain-containing protein [Hoeflea sp. YIM 152468]MDF1608174.1 FCD domain-containing protein [Hoeflea sp. YIM 152468]